MNWAKIAFCMFLGSALLWGCENDPYKNVTPAKTRQESPQNGIPNKDRNAIPTPNPPEPSLKPAERTKPEQLPFVKTQLPKLNNPSGALFKGKEKKSLLLGKGNGLSLQANQDDDFSFGKKSGGLNLGGSKGLSLGGLSLDSSLDPGLPLGDLPPSEPPKTPTSQPATSQPATSQPVVPVDPVAPAPTPTTTTDAYPKDGILAKINETPIKVVDFVRSYKMRKQLIEMQSNRTLSSDEEKKMKRGTLDSLISQVLLFQRANQRGISVTPQERNSAYKQFLASLPPGKTLDTFLQVSQMSRREFEQQLRKQLILQKYMKILASEISVSRSAVNKLYKESVGDGKVRARQIVVSAPEGTSQADLDKAKLRAQQILSLAQQTDADFAALAKKYSNDPSSSEGGDLGYIKRGEILETLEKEIFDMKSGELRGPIQTPIGFHILKVVSRQAPEPLFKVQQKLLMQLRMKKLKARLVEMATQLRSESDVEIYVPWGK